MSEARECKYIGSFTLKPGFRKPNLSDDEKKEFILECQGDKTKDSCIQQIPWGKMVDVACNGNQRYEQSNGKYIPYYMIRKKGTGEEEIKKVGDTISDLTGKIEDKYKFLNILIKEDAFVSPIDVAKAAGKHQYHPIAAGGKRKSKKKRRKTKRSKRRNKKKSNKRKSRRRR